MVQQFSIVRSEDLYSVDLQFAQQNLQIAQIARLQEVYTFNTVDSKYRDGPMGHKKFTNNVISRGYSIINCFYDTHLLKTYSFSLKESKARR